MKVSLEELRDNMKRKFETIKWAHHPCGRGSCFELTEITRTLLEDIVEKYNIKTVSDAGAGDLSWVHSTNWDVEYTGYDIRKWHPDIIEFDVTKDVLPKSDLIICRHVLNHIPAELREEAIDRFKESGSKYLFLTHGNPEPPYGLEKPLIHSGEKFPGGRTWYYGLYEIN
jgi:hypothetical protein